MKRTIIVLLVVFMLLSLALGLCACGKKGICEMCFRETWLKKITVGGQTGHVCEDCAASLRRMENFANSWSDLADSLN